MTSLFLPSVPPSGKLSYVTEDHALVFRRLFAREAQALPEVDHWRVEHFFKFWWGVFLDLKLQARKPGDKSLAVWNPGGCVLESYHVCHVNFLLISGGGSLGSLARRIFVRQLINLTVGFSTF